MKYLIIGLLIIVLIFAACDGGDSGQTSGDQNTAAQNNAGNTATQNTDDENTDNNNQEADSGTQTADNVGSELANLLGQKSSLTYMVDYTVKSTDMADSQMKQYMKGTDKIRFDTTSEDGEARIFWIDSALYMCTKDSGEWMCLSGSEGEEFDMESQTVEDDLQTNIDDYEVSNLPSRTIAGTLASCYNIVVETGSVEYCLSPEGVTVYMKTSSTYGEDSFEMEMIATSYSTNVPDSAFDLPAEPTSFEDMLADMNLDDMNI